MPVFTAQNLVHEFALIREKQKSLRVLVKPPDRVNALRVLEHVHDIRRAVVVRRRADHTDRLIDRDQNLFFGGQLLDRADPLAVYFDFHAGRDQRPEFRRLSRDRHLAGRNEPVRLTARANARRTQELVDAHSLALIHCSPPPAPIHASVIPL